MINGLSNKQKKPGSFLKKSDCDEFQRDYSLIGHFPPKKFWILKSSLFPQTKKKETNIQKIKTYFPLWLRHHVLNTNLVIGSFALNFSHQQFIRCKVEINIQTKKTFPIYILLALSLIIGSLIAAYTKILKFMSAAVCSINKKKLHWNERKFSYSNDVTNVSVFLDSQMAPSTIT